jgi:hypothetical protein
LVVVGGGVVMDVDLMVVEVVVTTGLELEEVVDLEVVKVINVEVLDVCAVVEGAGAGSFTASTQYDFPTTRFPQSAMIDGFCSLRQHI